MFFWGIYSLLALGIIVISALAVFPEFYNKPVIAVHEVFSAPDVNVNFGVIDSTQVKNLQPFMPGAVQNSATGQSPFSSTK